MRVLWKGGVQCEGFVADRYASHWRDKITLNWGLKILCLRLPPSFPSVSFPHLPLYHHHPVRYPSDTERSDNAGGCPEWGFSVGVGIVYQVSNANSELAGVVGWIWCRTGRRALSRAAVECHKDSEMRWRRGNRPIEMDRCLSRERHGLVFTRG